jgi:hypothetical protein
MMVRSNPVRFPVYFPIDEDHKYVKHIMFGNYGTMNTLYRNPYAEMVRGGYMNDSRSQMLAQLELKQNLDFIIEGLNIRTLLNISRTGSFSVSRKYSPFWYQVEAYDRVTDKYRLSRINPESGLGVGTEYLDLAESPKSLESTLYSETVMSYGREFADKHSLGGVLVFTAREHLTANAGSLQLSLPSRNAGLSGRATYSFDSRYFAEFNLPQLRQNGIRLWSPAVGQ